MRFNSEIFFVFFGALLVVHHLRLSWSVKKLNLLAASYLFYAAWNPPFVLLLMFSTIVDWFAARALAAASTDARRRLMLLVSLVVNLGVLSVFKYGNFLLENIRVLSSWLDWSVQPGEIDIILPVGISFYTFQTLSYTMDVYHRRSTPADSFLDYSLYVSFFPQLVAGPIVRATTFLPKCKQPTAFDLGRMGWGLSLLVLGLFQKVFVADFLMAPIAESVFRGDYVPDGVECWIGTLAFTIQIFADFAGYSTCAIGVALCIGFGLPDNFRFPYAAIGFSDFWTRWHVSLSSWLRDYLYISLGGNRRGRVRTYVNLMITMLLGGLWHGASWTFVAWGGLHGFLLIVERACRATVGHWMIWRRWLSRAALGGLTLACIMFTWVLFRAQSFHQAFDMIASMLGVRENSGQVSRLGSAEINRVLIVFGSVIAVHVFMRNRRLGAVVNRAPQWLIGVALGSMILLILGSTGDDRAFIYFQF